MEDRVDTVLDPRAVVDEHRSLSRALAHAARFRIGDPDAGKEVHAEKLSEDLGVDLVGLDFGLSDHLGAERITDDDFFDEGSEDGGDGPGVGGGFQSDAIVFGEMFPGERFDDGAGGEEALGEDDFAVVVEDHGLDFFLVDI